jgi:hypothetical protein
MSLLRNKKFDIRHDLMYTCKHSIKQTQSHSKMKHKITNIALEGTCNGDVVGGLLLWTAEHLQALLFLTPRDRRVRLKRTSLVPARGLTQGESEGLIMGVRVRQKTKGKGNPWWVFISHNGKRTSRKVGDKKAAEEVGSTIRAKLQLGEFGFEEEKPVPTFTKSMQRCGLHCLMIGKSQHGKIILTL